MNGLVKPQGLIHRRNSQSRLFGSVALPTPQAGAGVTARRSIVKAEGRVGDNDHEGAIARLREELFAGLLFLAAAHPSSKDGVALVNKVRCSGSSCLKG